MRIDVVTQPAVEPVTLSDVWDWLNLVPTTDSPQVTPFDAKLESMITAAREECENTTNRAFVRQTVKLTLPRFPRLWCGFYPGSGWVMDHATWPNNDNLHRHRIIELPRPPLISVTSTDYILVGGRMPALVQPLNNAWPDTYLREDAVQITYVCGYEGSGSPPDLTDGVPKGIVQAIKMLVEKNFNPMSLDQRKQLESAIACSLAKHKVYSF
jgi:hypothetical protein